MKILVFARNPFTKTFGAKFKLIYQTPHKSLSGKLLLNHGISPIRMVVQFSERLINICPLTITRDPTMRSAKELSQSVTLPIRPALVPHYCTNIHCSRWTCN
jgi:hypothetical protein